MGIVINGVTNTTLVGNSGTFSTNITTTTLPAGTYTVALQYPGDTNLSGVTNVTSVLVINQKTLQITANDATAPYGTTFTHVGAGQTAFTANGLINGDSVSSVTISATNTPFSGVNATDPAGNYNLVPSAALGTGLSNYSINYNIGTLIVDKAHLIFAPIGATNVFDGTALNVTNYSTNIYNYTITGYQNSDNATTIGLGLTGAMAFNGSVNTTVRNVNNYTLTNGTLGLAGTVSNYTLEFVYSATKYYAITPKTLTVTGLTANNKTADGTTTASLNLGSANLSGIISPDVVTLNSGSAVGNFTSAAAGVWPVTVSGLSLGGANASNYSLTQPSATGTITPAALDRYQVAISSPRYTSVPFYTYVTALDAYGNTVITNTTITLSSTGPNLSWDANGDSTFGNTLTENTLSLTNGVATIITKDNVEETGITVTATDTHSITGTSAPFNVLNQYDSYRSHQSGLWSDVNTWEEYNGTSWVYPAPHIPGTGGSGTNSPLIIIQSSHTVTLNQNVSEDMVRVATNGVLVISNGTIFNLCDYGSGLGLQLQGSLINQGTVSFGGGMEGTNPASALVVYDTGVFQNNGVVSNSTASTFEFYGGTYQHAMDGGTIPVAGWLHNSINSTCEIIGYTNSTSTLYGLNQSFQVFVWNCTNQISQVTLAGNFLGVDTLNIVRTGSGNVSLGANLTVTNLTTVASGAYFDCAAYVISGTGFTLYSGATLGIGSIDGITISGATGNVQTTTRSFSTGANYVYDGTAVQSAGNGLPVTVNSLTDNNNYLVTILQATTITSNLTLAAGAQLSLPDGTTSTAATFVVASTAKASGSWGSSISPATHQNNSYFTIANSGILNVAVGVPTSFTNLTTSQTINYGTPGVALSGTLTTAGSGETISITIDAVTTNVTTTTGGNLSVTFPTATLPHNDFAPYSVTYSYAGSANLNPATDTSTTVTVQAIPLSVVTSDANKAYGTTYLNVGTGQTAFTAIGLTNGETIATVTISASGGTASGASFGAYALTPSAPSGGTFDANNYNISYVAGTLRVVQAPLALLLTSSANPSGYKSGITFTATLPGDATGSVIFATNGISFSTNTLIAGFATSVSANALPRAITNVITATYSGDSNYFSTTTNLIQIVTNHPPSAATLNLTRTAGLRMRIFWSSVTNSFSDADGDLVRMTNFSVISTNAITVATNNLQILYPSSAANVNDQLVYAISDGQGGTNIGVINLVVDPFVAGQQTPSALTVTNNAINAVFYGIPSYTYQVQRSTNLTTGLLWVNVSTNTVGTNGVINVMDTFSDLGGQIPASA